MKSIVIYKSQTGFTKKYAEWISQESGAECMDIKRAKKIRLSDYDAVIYGGWCMAGSITKLDWFKKQISSLNTEEKKIIVFMVGASPADSPDIPIAMERIFSGEEWKGVKTFYCPGGLDYDKMNFFSRSAMKLLAKSLSSKEDASEKDRKMAELISHSYDISSKKYIEPILKELMP